MKRQEVLIFPNFFTMHGLYRAYVTSSLADFLMQQGILASMPFVPTYNADLAFIRQYAHDLLDTCKPSGIILQGGSDVDPALYSSTASAALPLRETIPFRDYFEREVILWALERHVPILGICRGVQMLNVVLGGTLHPHLSEEDWLAHDPERTLHYVPELMQRSTLHHAVHFEANGVLHAHLGTLEGNVNSYHHQGIDQLAAPFAVEAKSPDGLIEAISWREKNILGVQWHPELEFAREDYRETVKLWLSWLS